MLLKKHSPILKNDRVIGPHLPDVPRVICKRALFLRVKIFPKLVKQPKILLVWRIVWFLSTEDQKKGSTIEEWQYVTLMTTMC